MNSSELIALETLNATEIGLIIAGIGVTLTAIGLFIKNKSKDKTNIQNSTIVEDSKLDKSSVHGNVTNSKTTYKDSARHIQTNEYKEEHHHYQETEKKN